MRQRKTPKIEVIAREAEVVKLRRGGMTWELIAQKTGFGSPSAALTAYRRACQRVIYEDVDSMRRLEGDRLDLAQAAIWNQVLQGNMQAITTLVKIMDRRSKLFGLDLPVLQKVEVTPGYTADSIDAEMQKLVRLLQQGE